MLPLPKSSSLFRSTKVSYTHQLNNLTHKNSFKQQKLNGTQVFKLNAQSKGQKFPYPASLSKNIRKNFKLKLEQPSYDNFLQSLKGKISLLQEESCRKNHQKKVKEEAQAKPSINQKTKQSQNESIQKLIVEQSPKRNVKKEQTDFGEKILKQIKESMNRTQRSGCMVSRGQKKKKRMIQLCKVVKIGWESSKINTKTEFNPEISMIKKNPSCLPRQSLREIYENLK